MPPKMSGEERAQRIATFKSVAACKSDDVAENYLESCGWNINSAIELYLCEEHDAPETRKRKEPTRRNGNSRNGAGPSNRAQLIVSSDDEDDAKAMATPPRDDDNVRAPMSFRNGPIVQQSFEQQYGNGIQSRKAANGAFDGIKDFKTLADQQKAALTARLQKNGASSTSPSKSTSSSDPRSLQSLFRPPIDILHAGDWESAKAASIERECWVLVNVQDMKEFASQTLNRDVWSNGGVKELIKSNFLFWQVTLDSADGQRMRSYYGVTKCPTIFIVDPRTGEKVTDVPLRAQDAVSICDSLTQFMDDFPDYATRDRLVGHAAPEDVEPHPDEAQSMEDVSTEPASSSNGDRKRKAQDEDEGDMNSKKTKLSADMDQMEEGLEEMNITKHDPQAWRKEVVQDGEPIKVLLRFPNGTKDTAELTGPTKLNALHQYLRGVGCNPAEFSLVLGFPKRVLTLDHAQLTLSQLGFSKSEMIHIEQN